MRRPVAASIAALAALRCPLAVLRGRLLPAALLALALPACHSDAGAMPAGAADTAQDEAAQDPVDQAQLRQALGALRPQRPGVADLYVVGFAGDASEDVFRNEVLYLRQLFAQRFGAAGRIATLINHGDNLGTHAYAPQASYDNLADTLDRIGKRMDKREDALLLFLTSHGTEQHELYLQFGPGEDAEYDTITPQELRRLLDDAGIRNRIIVISACYSGGFVPALKTADTLVITAARRDRPSFGCGNTASATYFGRAWLIDALARTTDMVESYRLASAEISAREKAEGEAPSYPQLYVGARIGTWLQHWRAQLPNAVAPPYPYPEPDADDATDAADGEQTDEHGATAAPAAPTPAHASAPPAATTPAR
ncbi:C13 family peptidase [Xanthomonas sp. CFBP 8445]|uniref:C13 family peptidase n=1 Tax=Xanthomonas sp. CFBP 8445 TaxID=2971236 RepID=UPI0021E05523|nr:C13 family peptidase [Xanthomonas sp. CFBP 8445]UYC10358.1 C13 family peptidase [Xanthomonas sp. CFBP 8445]